VYVVVRDRGVLLSEDFGLHWHEATKDIANFLAKQWGNAVVVNPAQPSTLYFSASERFNVVPEWWRWRHPGLFVSRNRGATWSPIISTGMVEGRFDGEAYLARVDVSEWWRSRGWFGFNPMGWAVDPTDGRHLYVHDYYGVWASEDGGEHWRAAMKGLATTCVATILCHPKRKGEVFLGLFDVGLFHTRDGGRTIERLPYPASDCANLALETRDGEETLYSVVVERREGKRFGRTLALSRDGGRTWMRRPAPRGARLGAVELDPFRPHVLYCGRWMSPDGGKTWQELALPSGWEGRVVPDPTAQGRLYAWNRRGVWLSTDGGQTWRDISAGIPTVHPGRREIKALAVLPLRGRVFVGSDVYGLFLSEDQGQHWRNVLPHCYISAIGCGNEGRTVVAGAWRPWYAPREEHQPGLFLSRDGGETWARIDTALGVTAAPSVLLVEPLRPSRIWLGTRGNGAFVGEFGE
jgi:photosystem II stability/assembly factor-like uncharacterized protein